MPPRSMDISTITRMCGWERRELCLPAVTQGHAPERENQEAFPAAAMDGFTAIRSMPLSPCLSLLTTLLVCSLLLNALIDFFSIHLHIPRRLDSDSHLITFTAMIVVASAPIIKVSPTRLMRMSIG